MARKPATKVPVPPMLGEDAAERKRVLNILAQRRYRKLVSLSLGTLLLNIGYREKKEGEAPGARVSC
jgi:hypothetical protein